MLGVMSGYPTPSWLRDEDDDAPPAPVVPVRPVKVPAAGGVGAGGAGGGDSAPAGPFRAAGEARLASLIEGLTPSQAEAVKHDRGPLLVLAGPGSGKTRVITRRIAALIARGVVPWQILAVTFTNKAAAEMRHRVGELLGSSMERAAPVISTFHSLCVRLLRRYCEMGGLAEAGIVRPGFTVMDADDQSKLIKTIITSLQLNTSNFPPRSVQEAISGAKNELLDAGEFAARANEFVTRQQARVYNAYQAECRRSNTLDFDDLLLLTAKMLRSSEAVRQECQRRYRYILIDEYQDTNRAQLVIATLLAGDGKGAAGATNGGPNICVVGDPDQSIYAWRGADISNILEFEEHYPGARVIALGENFRSREPILSAADRLIKRNGQRKHKPLISTRKGGEAIDAVICRDEHHEARLVVDWLKARVAEMQSAGKSIGWKDCAVFYRTNALSRVMEDAMRAAAIPYVMVRGTAFFQREEIRNAVAYLKAVSNPEDRISIERIINTPARGISDKTWDTVVSHAEVTGRSVCETLRSVEQVEGLTPRAINAVQKFMDQLAAWGSMEATGGTEEFMGQQIPVSLHQLVDAVLRDSGLQGIYAKEEERLENLGELVSSAAEFEQKLLGGEFDFEDGTPAENRVWTLREKLAAYLERVALVADTDAIDPSTGAVTLMTLHAAKGLEYPIVAMIGLEEGCLPHIRGLDSTEALEEERRLCFVGITRAMDRLLMTSAGFRTLRGSPERTIPSRFLDELAGPELRISDQGYGQSLRSRDDDDDDSQGMHLDDLDQRAGGEDEPVFQRGGGAGGGKAKPAPFPPGCIVRHPQFGLGVVKSVTPGANARVQVEFKHAGVKTLVLEFARLERVK
jgi:DNA helicase-2/ATP-dependent DNA helicase PcrA